MKLVHSALEVGPDGRAVCLAIGVFDGVHLGHQQIIRQTLADARQHGARSLIVTFDRHPHAVVAPERAPALIYSLPQKLRTLEALGADALLLLAFTPEFSRQTGEEFIRGLARDLGRLGSICVGADFVFGRERSGNVALLRKLGAELGFGVHGHAAVALDGQTVSSTRIREAIVAGELDAASQMLGRPYALAGPIVPGDRLGRQWGFPTANFEVPGRVLPPDGVYAACVCRGARRHPAVANLGVRPTLGGALERRVEAHLLDFTGELYGEELELEFTARLRGEIKFASLAELRAQIARDIVTARAQFGA